MVGRRKGVVYPSYGGVSTLPAVAWACRDCQERYRAWHQFLRHLCVILLRDRFGPFDTEGKRAGFVRELSAITRLLVSFPLGEVARAHPAIALDDEPALSPIQVPAAAAQPGRWEARVPFTPRPPR